MKRLPPAQEGQGRNGWGGYLKPRLIKLLQAIGLDVAYHRGAGDYLYYRDSQDHEVQVLDLVGGYGSLMLGHAHPVLTAEAQQLLASGRPMHAQGSLRPYATRLAQELARRARGDFCVVLVNSGAEAVDAAMKHAMLETGARTFLALEGAFHGKTLGAIQLTAHESYRQEFTLAGLPIVRVRVNDLEHLEAAFAQTAAPAGFIFEPIQGEGGVRPIAASFAQRARELCTERGIPLIADECQTGLGRTGSFLACEMLGVQPDYLLLSKALGGGLAKIAAVLIRRERYRDSFDWKHTSTYAEDDYSCAIALKTLELIDLALLARCRERGERLLAGLRRLQETYPDVIADVRGRGLLIGVEFRPLTRSPSFLLRFLSAQEYLVFILAGYLLRVHRIRVAPTLSDPFTLRLEPSASIGDDALEHILTALADGCARLQMHDALGLTAHLSDDEPFAADTPIALNSNGKVLAYDADRFDQYQGRVPPVRVAWLCHLIDADDLPALEGAFGELSFPQREALLERLAALVSPVVMSAVDIRSRRGDQVRLYPILLPVTSRWMKRWIDARQYRFLQGLVQQSIQVARSLGCGVVALGQYTSIATLNGTSLRLPDMGLTSGNSYAIALVIEALQRAHQQRGSDPAESVLAVAGAAGNLGRTCAAMLAPFYRRVLLIGSDRPGSRQRLQELAQRLPAAAVTTDLAAIQAADVVVAAMNSVEAPLRASHFAANAIVCDIAVPPSVQPDARLLRPDLLLIQGGTVRLPFGEDLEIVGFPLPPGHTYGCMAEGILLGFEGVRDATFTGSLTAEHVRRIEGIAARHGFELADFKTRCVLGSERREVDRVHAG